MWIDRLVRFLLPRQDIFFAQLEQIAAKMIVVADVFNELSTASSHAQIAAIAGRLKPIETEADNLCHLVYEELDRTFQKRVEGLMACQRLYSCYHKITESHLQELARKVFVGACAAALANLPSIPEQEFRVFPDPFDTPAQWQQWLTWAPGPGLTHQRGG